MKQKKLNLLNNMLLIFLLIQPILDIYMAVVGERLDIFGISIATLIRTSFVVIMFGIVAIYQIKNKHHIKALYIAIGYILTCVIYVFIHHLNIVNSGGYYITEGIYNITTEIMYIARLIIPVLIIYSVIITMPNKEKLNKVLIAVAVIVSTVIIISNIFKVSFASYSQTGENIAITYNIFDWFEMSDIPYRESLSKGFFVSANQIGALLVTLLPIVIYNMLKEDKNYLYFIFLIQIVAMTLIGTRVASLGWMLVCIAMAGIYIILLLAKKVKKISLQSLLAILLIVELGLLIYANSPTHNREFAESYDGMYDEEIEDKEDSGEYIALEVFNDMLNDEAILNQYIDEPTEKGLRYDAMCKYISETHKYHYITKKYVNNIYPYTDDPEFWLQMFASPISIKADNRGRQVEIVKRIKEKNNNIILDSLFGMGATPMNSRGYMIENDLISHYYNLGIVGIILFMTPFVLPVISVIIKRRKNIFSLLNLELLTYVLSLAMTFSVGFFAGHVLDEYIVTLILGTISGAIFYTDKEEELNEKTYA